MKPNSVLVPIKDYEEINALIAAWNGSHTPTRSTYFALLLAGGGQYFCPIPEASSHQQAREIALRLHQQLGDVPADVCIVFGWCHSRDCQCQGTAYYAHIGVRTKSHGWVKYDSYLRGDEAETVRHETQTIRSFFGVGDIPSGGHSLQTSNQ